MHTIQGGHASLRYDANPDDLADYLAHVVHQHRLDLLTCTEARSRRLAKTLRRQLGPGYRVARRREYLWAWRRDTLAGGSALARLVTLAALWYWMLGRLGRRFIIGSQLLSWRSARRPLRVYIAHAPSSIQQGTTWRRDAPKGRVPAAQAGFRRWGQRIRAWGRRHERGVQLACMDSNLDQRRRVWRDYLAATVGGESLWDGRLPVLGTHGTRVIDTVHAIGDDLELPAGVVLNGLRPEGMDHRVVLYVLAAS